MKKSYLLLAAWVFLMLPSYAQNVAINTDGSLPNPNAILDIKSGNKGLLIPRMSSAARSIIANTKGLLVYDTTTNSFWYNTGTQWQNMASASSLALADSAWLLTGNSGTTDSVNFLGTRDSVQLNIRVNNQPSGRIDHIFNNTFWGYKAGANTVKSFIFNNTGIGSGSLGSNTTGDYNTALGAGSLASNTIGTQNTAFGMNALSDNVDGKFNTAGGTFALSFNVNGSQNTAYGWNALAENFHGNNNTATGAFSQWTSQGSDNVSDGYNTLTNNTTGSGNVAVGAYALIANRTGIFNVANGFNALYHNYGGNQNTATGAYSMQFNTEGYGNTANGFSSLQNNTTGLNNTATGGGALLNNTTGSNNVAEGVEALLFNITGENNTSVGYQSMFRNTTGGSNAAFGLLAMYANATGSYNSAVGLGALEGNFSGDRNTAFGTDAMHSNLTGSNNTAIGYQANVFFTNLTNAMAIGNGAVVDASNKVRIGNSAVTVIEGQVPFTTPSDGRFKFHVQEDVKGLDFILHLRPVTYQFDVKRFDAQWNHPTGRETTTENYALQAGYDEATRIRRTGFIAQEVEQAAIKANYDFSGIIKPKTEQDHYSLSYDAFVVPLVKAVQEQQKIIDTQNREIAAQRQMNDAQNKKIAEQEQTQTTQDKKIADLQKQLTEIKKLLTTPQPNN